MHFSAIHCVCFANSLYHKKISFQNYGTNNASNGTKKSYPDIGESIHKNTGNNYSA